MYLYDLDTIGFHDQFHGACISNGKQTNSEGYGCYQAIQSQKNRKK